MEIAFFGNNSEQWKEFIVLKHFVEFIFPFSGEMHVLINTKDVEKAMKKAQESEMWENYEVIETIRFLSSFGGVAETCLVPHQYCFLLMAVKAPVYLRFLEYAKEAIPEVHELYNLAMLAGGES